MIDESLNTKRIRDYAPYRKSMSLTEDDLRRAAKLERLFSIKFSSEAPFNFSKTISKALELAILQMLQPGKPSGPVQSSLTGQAADQGSTPSKTATETTSDGTRTATMKPRKPKKFQKTKRGF